MLTRGIASVVILRASSGSPVSLLKKKVERKFDYVFTQRIYIKCGYPSNLLQSHCQFVQLQLGSAELIEVRTPSWGYNASGKRDQCRCTVLQYHYKALQQRV